MKNTRTTPKRRIGSGKQASWSRFGTALGVLGAGFVAGALLTGCGQSGGGGLGSTTAGVTSASGSAMASEIVALQVAPAVDIVLEDVPGTGFQVIVDGYRGDGSVIDLTRSVTIEVDDPLVARVSGDGLVEAIDPGATTLRVRITTPRGVLVDERAITVTAPVAGAAAPTFTKLEVFPKYRVLDEVDAAAGKDQLQQAVLVGTDATGRAWDLTRSVGLRVTNLQHGPSSVATISASGLVRGVVGGEEALLVGRIDEAGLTGGAHLVLGPGNAVAPTAGQLYRGAPLTGSSNPIDVAVLGALKAQLVEPSELSDDAEFLRRLYADALGRLPSEAEQTAFAARTGDRRTQTIDAVIASREWADRWGALVGEWFLMPRTFPRPPAVSFDRWAADSLAANRTLAQLVTDLATGQGSGGGLFDGRHQTAADKVDILVLAGTGMTAKCAKCHDHPLTGPSDRIAWKQADRYPLDAFFATDPREAIPLDKAGNRSGNGGRPFQPAFVLDPSKAVTSTVAAPVGQRRFELAQLLTSSRAWKRGLAHRAFAHISTPLLDPNQFLQRNLDQVGVPALLEALTDAFDASGTSLQGYLRTVFTSRTWQLTSRGRTTTNDSLRGRSLLRRARYEVTASLITTLTGQGTQDEEYLKDTFGYPRTRLTIDERTHTIHLGQPALLANSPSVQGNVTAQGGEVEKLAAAVTAGTTTRAEAVRKLFRLALSREPSADETKLGTDLIAAAPTVRAGLEDVAAGLMGTVEAATQ